MNDFGGICIPLMIMGYHVCHGDWVIIARPGGFGSLPMSTGQVASLTASPGEISDRLPMCSAGTFPGGPCYSSLGGPQQPPVGLVSTSASVRASVQAPTMQNCPPKPPFSEVVFFLSLLLVPL